MASPDFYTLTTATVSLQPGAGISVQRVHDHGQMPPHDHLFHELVYIESGTAEHQTVAGTQPLRPGDLIVIRPQVWHAYRQPRRLCLFNCLFDSRLTRRFADLLRSIPGSFDLYLRRDPHPSSESPVVLHSRPAQRSALIQRLQTIIAEQDQQAAGWELATITGLLDVMLITARWWAQQSPPEPRQQLPSRAEQAVFDAVIHLEAAYTTQIDLTELAEKVHLSRWHFSRIFSQRMGMGVIEFVHHLRIEEACRRLRLTEAPVTQIALDLGYNDVSYFTRCFTKRLGENPRAYRRRSRPLP